MEEQDKISVEFATDILALLNGLRPESDNANVYTPLKVVQSMLNILPKDIWTRKDIKFLDPVCKSGIFLREITKRLVDAQIKADGKKLKGKDRLPYIQSVLKNQIFGIAISEEAALVSRRTVYGSQNARSRYSLSEGIFEDIQGNIRFVDNNAADNKKGAQYPFLNKSIHEIFGENMHFDVIIGNPPYHEVDGSGASTDAGLPIYNLFIEKGIALQPKYVSMIVESKWMVGGRGLDKFRENMINDHHFKKMYDFEDSSVCFQKVHIDAGVNYFLWDRDYDGMVEYHYQDVKHNDYPKIQRYLGNDYDFPYIIRDVRIIPIINKLNLEQKSFSKIVSSTKPFGIRKDLFNKPERYPESGLQEEPFEESVKVYGVKGIKGGARRKIGYIKKSFVLNSELCDENKEWIKKEKIFFTTSYSSDAISAPPAISAGKDEICTETFLVIGPFSSTQEKENCLKFMNTNLFKFLLYYGHGTMQVTKSIFGLIPIPGNTINEAFSRPWTDKDLYEKYNITEDEQKFIDSMIKPME